MEAKPLLLPYLSLQKGNATSVSSGGLLTVHIYGDATTPSLDREWVTSLSIHSLTLLAGNIEHNFGPTYISLPSFLQGCTQDAAGWFNGFAYPNIAPAYHT